MAKRLGKLEIQFFAYIQQQKIELIKTGDVVPILNISPKQERELLSRMAKNGLIIRLLRGYYLTPKRIPPGGKWSADKYVLLDKLMKIINGRYQISGFNAFNFYGFSEQIPNRVYVYNNKLSGEKKIAAVNFVFMKTDDKRLGGNYEFTTPDGIKVYMASKEKTLVDAVYDWSRYNSLPKAYKWITDAVKEDEKFIKKLVDAAVKFGNQGTLRRVGCLLNSIGAEKKFLNKIKKSIKKSKSLIPFIPNKTVTGTVDKEWGVIINE